MLNSIKIFVNASYFFIVNFKCKENIPYSSDNAKFQIDVMGGCRGLKRSALAYTVTTCILFRDVENNALRFHRWMGGWVESITSI